MRTRKTSPPDADTTARLLDTAEKLFAEHGFDGVGMRTLADEAGVNLGAATYHYGSKEKLYIETFMRRFRPANAERLELLRRAQAAAKGKPLPVETLVECMLRPPFMTALAHPHFPALMARNLFMPPPFMQGVVEKELRPNLDIFVEALAKSLPKLPRPLLMIRVMLSGGALLMFAGHVGRMPPLAEAKPKFMEFGLRELVRYVAAGLQANPAVAPKELPSFPLPPHFPRV